MTNNALLCRAHCSSCSCISTGEKKPKMSMCKMPVANFEIASKSVDKCLQKWATTLLHTFILALKE